MPPPGLGWGRVENAQKMHRVDFLPLIFALIFGLEAL
jgi:hypothetical protein